MNRDNEVEFRVIKQSVERSLDWIQEQFKYKSSQRSKIKIDVIAESKSSSVQKFVLKGRETQIKMPNKKLQNL